MTDDDVGTVEVPVWVARLAADELARLIERTGGPDEDAEDANTPLAEARERITDKREGAFTPGIAHGMTSAVDTLDEVAEERGVDATGSDPLTDRVFRAKDALRDAVESAGGEQA